MQVSAAPGWTMLIRRRVTERQLAIRAYRWTTVSYCTVTFAVNVHAGVGSVLMV